MTDTLSDLPESKTLFVGNKSFFFDVGCNRFGVFLRISEVRTNARSSVTIPEQHCARFRDIITELSNKISEQATVVYGGPSETGDGQPEGKMDCGKQQQQKEKEQTSVVTPPNAASGEPITVG